MQTSQAPNASNRREPIRLLALSDGLFATVLTLLVLDLRLPEALSGQGLTPGGFLRWIGPHLFAYLLTFFVSGIYWLAHHRNFDLIVSYDRGLLGYNLLFLLFVGLFPFSTAAISSFSMSAAGYSFYWAVYAGNIILAGIMLALTWLYAVSHGQVDAGTARVQSLHIIVRQLTIPAAFLASVLTQYLFPRALLGPLTLMLIPVLRWGVDRYYVRADPDQPLTRAPKGERLWRAGTTLIWVLIILLAAWASAQ
ncbi:MAG TPA: TMEM175 family protein [Anaerolineales bacterium]